MDDTTLLTPHEGAPSMRAWDFTSNPHVMIVTTTLRRVWTIDPDGLAADTTETTGQDEATAQAVAASHASPRSGAPDDVIGQVARALPYAPSDERWDDEVWRSTAHYTLLNLQEFPDDPESEGMFHDWLFTPLRHKVYETFNHVFWDAYHGTKDDDEEVIGEFKPPNTTIMSIRGTAGESEQTTRTCNFDTDTFVYPIWTAPKSRLTFAVGGSERTYGPEGKSWTFTLWFRAGEKVTITSSIEAGEKKHQWAAVLALGPCEPRPLPKMEDHTIGKLRFRNGRPWCKDGDGEDEGKDGPEIWPEAVHLARAIFLKAGNAVDTCTLDDMNIGGASEGRDQGSRGQLGRPDVEHEAQSEAPSPDGLYAPISKELGIRLLVIEPATSLDQALRTRLEIVDLDSAVKYEAISYTWGDPADKTTLRCNKGSVMVPRNLESILKKLRRSGEARRVWADSVCINQEDIAERSQQVSIMRHIYQKATRVVAWLGPDEHDQAHTAFSTVCDIVRIWRPKDNRMAFSSYDTLLEPMDEDQTSEVRRAVSSSSWDSIRSLFENTYFRRFWVIQELALGDPAVVVWGDHHISWGLIGICAAWVMTSGWNYGYGRAPVGSAFNAFLIYVLPLAKKSGISMLSRLDFSALLGMTMGFFDSTDTRDRIYAFLGLSFAGNNPDADLILTPDYSQSLQSVYTHAARRILEHDMHLRMLSAVQHGPDIDSSWPSWVPMWHKPLSAEPLALQGEQGYYANGGELFCPSDESFSSDGLSLNLQGLLCDTVAEVTDVFEKGEIGFHVLTSEKHVEAMSYLIGVLHNEGKQLRASWSATLEEFTLFGFGNPDVQAEMIAKGEMRQAVVSAQPGKYGMRAKAEMVGLDRAQSDHFAEFLLYWRERASWDAGALRHRSMRPFWDYMDQQTTYVQERALCAFNTFAGRRLFFLDDGTPGVGPAAMRPGDVVAILFGGIVPFVLRPLENSDAGEIRCWQLVGECFVPTLMQGEAVEEAGLLAEGTYERESGNSLRLVPGKEDETDPRFERKVGENNVYLFQIY